MLRRASYEQIGSLPGFHPAVAAWFTEQLGQPTEVQSRGWASIAAGGHTLLCAPTGSGKTLAAFLWGISELAKRPLPEPQARMRLLYISPLRALNYDIDRNLRAPLAGLARHAMQLGEPVPDLRVGVRTGDTSQKERNQQRRNPPDIFITTPESLYVMLTTGARELFDSVETVIIDEVHALAQSKRGTHLALTLARLAERVAAKNDGRILQRIAVSATQKPIERIAAFVGGTGAEVDIVQTIPDKVYDVQVRVPVEDMTAHPQAGTRASVIESLDQLDQVPTSNAGALGAGYSIWNALHNEVLDLVEEHTSTICFTNSRRLAERIALALNELAAERFRDRAHRAEIAGVPFPEGAHPPIVARAHHGSIARETRKEMEEQLKAGQLPCIVATSSLELGIDMGAVDLVVHVEAPKSVASGIQRIGRAGHGVGEVSRGRIYPKHRSDLLEAAAVTRAIVTGDLEPVHVPELCLDVLAQQLVAIAAEGPIDIDAMFELTLRAWPYRELTREQFDNLLNLLAGGLPGEDLVDLRPRLVHDRAANTVEARSDAARMAIMNAGTIPDRGLYGVYLAESGFRVGELDEEMVHETRLGEIIILGASSWRVEDITRDRVIVTPMPGAIGKTPFWHGEGLGRSVTLGRKVGELARRIVELQAPGDRDAIETTHATGREAAGGVFVDTSSAERNSGRSEADDDPFARLDAAFDEPGSDAGDGRTFEGVHGAGGGDSQQRRTFEGVEAGGVHPALVPLPDDPAIELLRTEYLLDARAAANLAKYVRDQQEATGEIPTDRTVVIERFKDELGDWRICILTPFGKAVHGPWAMAIEAQLAERHNIDATALWSDDGIALRVPDTETQLAVAEFLIDPEAIEQLVIDKLADSALFAGRFREIAARALILGSRGFDKRSPLWLQRIKAHDVLQVASQHPSFPMVLETYRECMRDVFDMPALTELLQGLATRQVRVVDVQTKFASPMASSLLFDYTASLLYGDDKPAAERRAQTLALDIALLRELLGTDEFRELLEQSAIDEVEAELQRCAPERNVRSVDAVHDLLRELGDLTLAEIDERLNAEKAGTDAAGAAAELARTSRAVSVKIAGEQRIIAADDAGIYRDALGVQLPPAILQVYLEPVDNPVDRLVARWARTHAPFTSARPAARWGTAPESIQPVLDRLTAAGELMNGGFLPAGTTMEWVDPTVLRRIRRRTLAQLRAQIEPVDREVLARFLATWHRLDVPPPGSTSSLRDALLQLEGITASASVWERDYLAPRLARYRSGWLDELVQSGQVTWVGSGVKHGAIQVAFFAAGHVELLAPEAEELPDDDPVLTAVHAALESSGASFVHDLTAATGTGEAAVLDALWRLAALGRTTCDSFAAVREGHKRAKSKPPAAPARSIFGSNDTPGAVDAHGNPIDGPALGPDGKPIDPREANTAGGRPRFPAERAPGRATRRGLRLGARGVSTRAGGGRNSGRVGGAWQGRWSLLPTTRASVIERQQATAEALLDCWGVLTRDAVASRGVPGGFSVVYAELSRAEELGLVRRGYFVDGLGGAQFAMPEAVDLLRAEQHLAPPDPARAPIVMLRATDPAQPYGTIIDWPERDGLPKPSRSAVAYVAIRGGQLLAHFSAAGKTLNLYESEALRDVAAALAEVVRSGRLDRISVERIDGAPLASDHVAAFADNGFVRTPMGVQATAQTVTASSTPAHETAVAANVRGRSFRPGHPHDPRQH